MQPKKKSRRHRMLGKIHIEKDEQGMSDEAYRDLLRLNFGVESARDLTDAGLGRLIDFMAGGTPTPAARQVEALKEKALRLSSGQVGLSPERFRGLVKKVCGVEDLRWYRGDAVRLKKLLAELRSIIEKESHEDTKTQRNEKKAK